MFSLIFSLSIIFCVCMIDKTESQYYPKAIISCTRPSVRSLLETKIRKCSKEGYEWLSCDISGDIYHYRGSEINIYAPVYVPK